MNISVVSLTGAPAVLSTLKNGWPTLYYFSTISVFIFFYIFNNGNLVNLIRLISFEILCFVFSCTQPFLEAASLWSRVAITEQAVAANLPPGFLTSPHVIVPDLEYSLKV